MFQLLELSTSVNIKLMKIILPSLRKNNISTSEFIALWKVNKKAAKSTDLARAAGILPSTMTAMLDRFEKRGLIHRGQDSNDRRIALIEGTQELDLLIKKIIAETSSDWAEFQEVIPQELSDTFINNLEEMKKHLDGMARK